jgi:hypothetical protein
MRNLVISKNIAKREYRSLDLYFHDIDKIDLITENRLKLANKELESWKQWAINTAFDETQTPQ